jgi:Family of unknown function (DUF6064)
VILPFSRAEFFSVFSLYNESVWPAQLALYALALIATILVLRRSTAASRGINVVLGILWLWMGVVYHIGFFARINRAAFLFGVIFVVQSYLFFRLAIRSKEVVYAPRHDLAGWAGGGLVALGLFIYPVLTVMAGQDYPAQPTFGLPCPTTIFTLGMLLWGINTVPRHMFVIPVLWSAIGTLGAFQLDVTEDFTLAVAMLVIGAMWLARTADWAHTVLAAPGAGPTVLPLDDIRSELISRHR